MRPIKSILVPVGKFSARSLPIVNKAAQLAAALSARLELFHDMADPIMLAELGRPGLIGRPIFISGLRSFARVGCLLGRISSANRA